MKQKKEERKKRVSVSNSTQNTKATKKSLSKQNNKDRKYGWGGLPLRKQRLRRRRARKQRDFNQPKTTTLLRTLEQEASHQHLTEWLPLVWKSRLSLVLFNRGDFSWKTTTASKNRQQPTPHWRRKGGFYREEFLGFWFFRSFPPIFGPFHSKFKKKLNPTHI